LFETVSPENWSLSTPGEEGKGRVKNLLGLNYDEIAKRARNAVYEFLERLYDLKEEALYHYYRADNKRLSEKDSGNFLMAVNFLVMFDLLGDEEMLNKARSCYNWAYKNCTEIHPMFTWQGGVRDGFKSNELYVKYTGDAFLSCLSLYARTGEEEYLRHIRQYHSFIKQARKAGFRYKFDTNTYRWIEKGFCWQSFGYPICAYLQFYEMNKETRYLEEAIAWGEHALSLQRENGAFYLIDGEFWNSDLAPVELRALTFLYEATGRVEFLDAARCYADWLVEKQNNDGSWPIGIDRDDEICAPIIGPGDVPNTALSLIRLHMNIATEAYLEAAIKAIRYSISMQALEGGKYSVYLDDPHVKWGFWSWDPLHDCSLSGDQSVHHIRGMLFTANYIGSLGSEGKHCVPSAQKSR